MKMIQFFESFPSVLPTTTMMNGQVFTIKVVQLQVSIDTCCGILKYRETSEPHKDHWYTDSDKQLMETYIARHKDEYPLSLLEDLRKEAAYGCSDPRLHLRAREQADRLTEEAEKRLEDDFQTLSLVLTACVEQHGVLPYCVVLQCFASRFLGAGVIAPSFLG